MVFIRHRPQYSFLICHLGQIADLLAYQKKWQVFSSSRWCTKACLAFCVSKRHYLKIDLLGNALLKVLGTMQNEESLCVYIIKRADTLVC